MKRTKQELCTMAEQQLWGFCHHRAGYSIISLIDSMGLKEEEWNTLRAEYSTEYLNDSDIEQITEYFKNKKG